MNPSFEDTLNCPEGFENISSAAGWYSASQTPDYFNPCANDNFYTVGAPDNIFGYQGALDGNAYAGISIFSKQYSWAKECIGTELTQNLNIGTEYYVSAYISLADSNSFDCAANKFGFKFSTTKYDAFAFNPVPIDNFAHIHSDNVISNKLEWTKISGSFIADSSYLYLSIGSFYDSTNMDTMNCINFSYYYVDYVCVSTDSLTCNGNVGVNQFEHLDFEFYPNPVENLIYFKNLDSPIKYSIFNIQGELLQTGFVDKYNKILDVSDLNNGIYFIDLDKKAKKQIIINR